MSRPAGYGTRDDAAPAPHGHAPYPGRLGRMDEIVVRRATTRDVEAVKRLVDWYAEQRILLGKARVTLYEDVQEFWVAEAGGELVGCGALHVMWEDLAEVRTLAVDPAWRTRGVGGLLLDRLVETARTLGVRRVVCLTFEVDFFARHGFMPSDGIPVDPGLFAELVQSLDEGVAEFLDLERVRPNTLGNTRMLLEL